jgi:Chaperone of endosialidase
LSTIGGGSANLITNSSYATVPGGYGNVASADSSFAGGTYAHATNTGAFVWADTSSGFVAGSYYPFYSTTTNEFSARATGGVRFVSGLDASGNPNAGVRLAPRGTAWATISDRNAKKNITGVDGGAVLETLASVPVQRWNYKWESDDSTPHIGPMAQDFKQAFYPGRDDKSINTLEFDGVELAAIQGLNQKLEKTLKAKDTEIENLKQQNGSLAQRLSTLERIVQSLAEKKWIFREFSGWVEAGRGRAFRVKTLGRA